MTPRHATIALALALAPSLAHAEEPTAEPLGLIGFGQIFAGHETVTSGDQSFNEFIVRRAELGMGWTGRIRPAGFDARYGFMINTEAIRSAGARSLFGIDNDSLVFRAKHAFALLEPELGPGTLRIRAGLIPDTWVATVETDYDLRGVSPTTSERGEFFDTSDLGAEVGYEAFEGLVAGRVSFTNGEGRNQRELNEGKNFTGVLTVRAPDFSLFGMPARVAVHGTWRDGSLGPSSRRNHRAAGAVTFTHPRLFVGGEFVRAFGYLGRAEQEAQGVGLWANGALYFPWLGAFARVELDDTDLTADSDSGVTRVNAGLYLDAIDAGSMPRNILGFPRFRLYVSYQSERFGADAAASSGDPDSSNSDALLITLSARANVATASLLTPSDDAE